MLGGRPAALATVSVTGRAFFLSQRAGPAGGGGGEADGAQKQLTVLGEKASPCPAWSQVRHSGWVGRLGVLGPVTVSHVTSSRIVEMTWCWGVLGPLCPFISSN